MEEFIRYLLGHLVKHPEAVAIAEHPGDRRTVFEIQVDPDDLGIVIGRSGRTINAIRTVVSAATAHSGQRVWIKLMDTDEFEDEDELTTDADGEGHARPPTVADPATAQGEEGPYEDDEAGSDGDYEDSYEDGEEPYEDGEDGADDEGYGDDEGYDAGDDDVEDDGEDDDAEPAAPPERSGDDEPGDPRRYGS